MPSVIKSIVHATDFSEGSGVAFHHALKIALAAQARLQILHVGDGSDSDGFPPVRRTLAEWGLAGEHDPPASIGARLGVKISKIELDPQKPRAAIGEYLETHPADLLVLSTHGRGGVPHWLIGSVAEDVARGSSAATLFVRDGLGGFVSGARGEVRLRNILVPVTQKIAWRRAVALVMELAGLLEAEAADVHFVHVESDPLHKWEDKDMGSHHIFHRRSGPVVEAILDVAKEVHADLIAMPTEGRHGVFDALRGSTTERIVHRAPCAVLAVPVG